MAKPCAGFEFFWLLIFGGMVTFVFGHQCNPFHKTVYVAENRALQGFVYARRSVRSRVICGRDCNMDERCKSFNFNDCNKRCELNLATRREHPGNFTVTPGTMYYDKDEDTLRHSLNDTDDCTGADPCSSDPCQNGGTCYQRQGYQSRQYCQCAPGFRGKHCQKRPRGCRQLHFRDIRQSGVYTIYPSKYPDGLEVYCDMDAAPGGWIVFQKRFDGSVNFTRNWTEYRNGFGNLTGEFWLGNEILHQLTSREGGRWGQVVRIDLEDDQAENQTYQAKEFGISGEKYTWTNGGGAQGHQAPPQLDGRGFSTYDMDNDEDTNANCAAELKGGWWLGTCSGTSGAPYGLNGEYQQGHDRGIIWAGWEGHRIVKSEMKLRLY